MIKTNGKESNFKQNFQLNYMSFKEFRKQQENDRREKDLIHEALVLEKELQYMEINLYSLSGNSKDINMKQLESLRDIKEKYENFLNILEDVEYDNEDKRSLKLDECEDFLNRILKKASDHESEYSSKKVA